MLEAAALRPEMAARPECAGFSIKIRGTLHVTKPLRPTGGRNQTPMRASLCTHAQPVPMKGAEYTNLPCC